LVTERAPRSFLALLPGAATVLFGCDRVGIGFIDTAGGVNRWKISSDNLLVLKWRYGKGLQRCLSRRNRAIGG
jgi:hypothetical protein